VPTMVRKMEKISVYAWNISGEMNGFRDANRSLADEGRVNRRFPPSTFALVNSSMSK